MKSALDCIPCFVAQALNVARLASDDPQLHERALRAALRRASEADLAQSPVLVGRSIHRAVRDLTGQADPYLTIKQESNRLALALLPVWRQRLLAAQNPRLAFPVQGQVSCRGPAHRPRGREPGLASLCSRIGGSCRRSAPDRVQLNTAVRPPAEDFAVPVPQARLTELARLFHPKAEVIAEYQRKDKAASASAGQQAILELLRRRPCTEEDVARGLAMRPIEAAKHLAQLESARLIVSQSHDGQVYYQLIWP
jgi:hypothetical protein